MKSQILQNRRHFLGQLSFGAALFTVPGLYAETLSLTPQIEEGPYYPHQNLPLDTDNDLLIVNDRITPAVGEVTQLHGRVLDRQGRPVRNALVEIWQVDIHGIYISDQNRRAKRDSNFQGFGRFLTGSTGEYYFRTIKPVPYANRTSHVHFAIKVKGREKWTTQCFVKGESRNLQDGLLNRIADSQDRAKVLVDFAPVPDSLTGQLAARFDIVMDVTPEV